MALNDSSVTSLPLRSVVFWLPSWSIIAFAIWSPARPQMSTTLL